MFTQSLGIIPRCRVVSELGLAMNRYVSNKHDCLDYTGPPGNEEQLVINAWCGGQGANSPAHTVSPRIALSANIFRTSSLGSLLQHIRYGISSAHDPILIVTNTMVP
jgi:hypothetical protein